MMARWSIRSVFAVLVFAVWSAACAPHTLKPLPPEAAFTGPRLAVDNDQVISFDGAALGLTVWAPEEAEPWAALVAVHGLSEYADSYHLAGPWWAERGVAVYAYDQRGFGRSPGTGEWPGVTLMHQDLRTVLDLVRARHPDATLAVHGQSMGGAVVLTALAASDAPLADRVSVTAPAVWGWSQWPAPYRVGLWLAARIVGPRALEPPDRTSDIRASDNIAALVRNGKDPLYQPSTRIDALYGLLTLMERALKAQLDDKQILFVGYGANDQVVPERPTLKFAETLGPCVRTAYYEDGWHMLLRDLQAETVWADLLAFWRDPTAPAVSQSPPLVGEEIAAAQPLPAGCET